MREEGANLVPVVVVWKSSSWCAFTLVVSFALSGCVGSDPAPPPYEVSFYTDWTDGTGHYVLAAPEPVPADLVVSVLEKETGVRQSFALAELNEEGPGAYGVPATIRLKHGNTYLLQATSGGETHGAREVRAEERSLKTPDRDLLATYDFTLDRAEEAPGQRSAYVIDGTMEIGSASGSTWSSATGTGAMNATEGTMAMEIAITEFEWAEVDDVPHEYRMIGTGPWSMTGDPSGSGTVDFRGELMGVEEKRDRQGVAHETMRSTLQMDITGTLTSEGMTFGFETIGRETDWTRLGDGRPIWVKGSETVRLTFPDGSVHAETDSFDEPAGPDAAEPDLLESTDFDGFAPTPWSIGDRVTLEGLDGARIRFETFESGERQLDDQTYPVMQVKGTVTGQITGSEDWIVVSEGPYRGLPFEWQGEYERGDEHLKMSAQLQSVQGTARAP